MDEPIFADKAHMPTDADLAVTLGRTKRHWDALVAHIHETYPSAAAGWKFYPGKSGWTFVVREKKRNLVYMKPMAKAFTAALALGDKAVAALADTDLPADLVESIRQSPKYPEGRPARTAVSKATDLTIVTRLLAVKAAN